MLIGPRDRHFESALNPKVSILGESAPLSMLDLIKFSGNVDLCVCNDTGVGHLMSQEGVDIDLWINPHSQALLHQVLPRLTRSIVIL